MISKDEVMAVVVYRESMLSKGTEEFLEFAKLCITHKTKLAFKKNDFITLEINKVKYPNIKWNKLQIELSISEDEELGGKHERV